MVTARKINVGVTLHVRKGSQSLWENGIFQNCIFMADLLRHIPWVGRVILVCGGDGDEEDRRRFVGQGSRYDLIGLADAMTVVDVAIEMSAGLNSEWVNAFRKKGGKVISYYVGNDFFLDAERIAFNLPNAWLVPDAPRDMVWTLDEYRVTCRPYYEAAVRTHVEIMPHLWGPEVIDRAAKETGTDGLDYRPASRRWRVGIIEPNLSMVKTFHMPALICENAHRANPNVLEHVWIFNTQSHMHKELFAAFANSLDIVKHGLATFETRHPAYEIFARHVDALVCHQWENAQNYVYYEALHLGFPLIHNSHLLDDCGYRYHDFDCEEGGRVLLAAYANHDKHLDDYRRRARRYVAKLSPDYPDNIEKYASVLQQVLATA